MGIKGLAIGTERPGGVPAAAAGFLNDGPCWGGSGEGNIDIFFLLRGEGEGEQEGD
jgi:hypothetical protein